MQVCARHSKSVVLQLLALAGCARRVYTYSASGERILQVADPKLLESVDCSKSIKYLHNMISV